MWGEGCGLRIGFQTMGRRRPLSRFMFGVTFWIWMGSGSSPQPEPFDSSLDCGAFPVDAVVCLLNINCNVVLEVSSFHRLSVFTQPDFQCPLGFSHINLIPYRGSHTPLLSASALGSCSSPALLLLSEFSLV